MGGSLNITTPKLLTIRDNSNVEVNSEGLSTAGNVVINSGSLTLENQGQISAATASGEGGLLDINVDNILSMRNNSSISAEAGGTGDGGNIDIDANFIVAFIDQNSDIIANAEQGIGGNINITAEGIFSIQERQLNPLTNDINASSEFSLDGTVSISSPDVNRLQTDTDLPENPIESKQTVAQACSANREIAAQNGLTIKGKGGILPEPTEPSDSRLLLVDGQVATPNLQTKNPSIRPIKTSIGEITPARGIIKTEDGQIILTAYRTDKIDTRTPHVSANCS